MHYVYEHDSFVPLLQATRGSALQLAPTTDVKALMAGNYGEYDIALDPLWNGEFEQETAPFSKEEIAFYQCDHLGTPQELTDCEGKVAWSAQYKAWGKAKEAISEAARKAGIRNPIRFQGQYLDDETGLHYNRYRYYDPDTARYLTQDPIGLIGGTNLYRYAPNSTAWIDPAGLSNKNCNEKASIRRRVLSNIAESQTARKASSFQEHGNREWPPNRGFKEEPVEFTLLPGSKIDRYGSPYGTFTSPTGTPYRARAPKPGTDLKPHCVYEVNKSLTVKAGGAAPWFGYEGNGTQYELPERVINLEKSGILTKIK